MTDTTMDIPGEAYERVFHAGWGLMDANAHLRNTAYLDLAADTRLGFYAERGFPADEFARLRIGPVVRRDELEYMREFRLLEPVRVTLAVAGLSDDVARWTIVNEFFRPDGVLAARVTSHGGWLDLAARKLTSPPPALAEAMRRQARTADYRPL